MTQPSDGPSIHVDSDWKAQAEAERQRLEKLDQAHAQSSPASEALPPADFRSIVGLLATQALGGLGAYGDPETKRVVVDLAQAQFAIDLLGVLEGKTKGNLSTEESAELGAILAELRSRFVHFSKLVASQGAATASASTPPGAPAGAASHGRPDPAKPKIIIPG
ncbi:MAG: DUF1844 domain-containing protein [Phycisphaerales bacterium]|nr:DUF1844 domain-containing protein [Phycisphaerales bacterium]